MEHCRTQIVDCTFDVGYNGRMKYNTDSGMLME